MRLISDELGLETWLEGSLADFAFSIRAWHLDHAVVSVSILASAWSAGTAFAVRLVFDPATGDVAVLNPRLMAGKPLACGDKGRPGRGEDGAVDPKRTRALGNPEGLPAISRG